MFGFGSAGVDVAELLALLATDPNGLATILRSYFPAVLLTPEVDFEVNVTGVAFSPVAGRAGFYFIPERALIYHKTLSGVFTTPLIIRAGNNAGENNVLVATTISAASLNASIVTPGPPTGINSAVGTPAAGNIYLDTATPITYAHTGATTTGVATGRVALTGAWVPI
jgi:hypothetical protein